MFDVVWWKVLRDMAGNAKRDGLRSIYFWFRVHLININIWSTTYEDDFSFQYAFIWQNIISACFCLTLSILDYKCVLGHTHIETVPTANRQLKLFFTLPLLVRYALWHLIYSRHVLQNSQSLSFKFNWSNFPSLCQIYERSPVVGISTPCKILDSGSFPLSETNTPFSV